MTVIENVPGAPIRADLVLTGAVFGLPTYRRRHFELSFFAMQPDIGRPFGPLSRAGSFTAAGNGGHGPNRPRLWAEGMDVRWMTDKHEIAQAIPPAYGEFIGRAACQWAGWKAPKQTPEPATPDEKPQKSGAPGRTRTCNHALRRRAKP